MGSGKKEVPVTLVGPRPSVEITTIASTPPSRKATPDRKRARRTRYNAALKVFRRTHLYFGLILVPFVLLYGMSAILFNHPTWFNATSTIVDNDPDLLKAHGGFAPLVIAEEVRASIEEEIGSPVELLPDPAPAFRGSFLIEFRGDTERRRYRVQPETLASTLQVTPLATGEEEERRFPEKVSVSTEESVTDLRDRLQAIAEDDSSSLRSAPDLNMRMRVDGEDWLVEYDLRNGQISERRSGEARMDFSLRSFLMRLHVSRGYPAEAGVRSIWGVIVDVTAALMIFWALSGVIMWWQLRPTRNTGMLALGSGFFFAGLLAYGMYVAIYH